MVDNTYFPLNVFVICIIDMVVCASCSLSLIFLMCNMV